MVLSLFGFDLNQFLEMHERLTKVLLVYAPPLLGRNASMDATHQASHLHVVRVLGEDPVGHGHRLWQATRTGKQIDHLDSDDDRPWICFQCRFIFFECPVCVLRAPELLIEVVVEVTERESVVGFATQLGGKLGGYEAGRDRNRGQKQSEEGTTDASPGRSEEPSQQGGETNWHAFR